jgi:hypothetical protein
MLTIAQAASAANISISDLMDEVQQGRLHTIKMVSGCKIHEVDFKAWKRTRIQKGIKIGSVILYRGTAARVTRFDNERCWIRPEGGKLQLPVKWDQLSRGVDGTTVVAEKGFKN